MDYALKQLHQFPYHAQVCADLPGLASEGQYIVFKTAISEIQVLRNKLHQAILDREVFFNPLCRKDFRFAIFEHQNDYLYDVTYYTCPFSGKRKMIRWSINFTFMYQ